MSENNKQIANRLRELADCIESCEHEYQSCTSIYGGQVLSIKYAPLDGPPVTKYGPTSYSILLGGAEFIQSHTVVNTMEG